MKTYKLSIIAISLFALSACGGGGETIDFEEVGLNASLAKETDVRVLQLVGEAISSDYNYQLSSILQYDSEDSGTDELACPNGGTTTVSWHKTSLPSDDNDNAADLLATFTFTNCGVDLPGQTIEGVCQALPGVVSGTLTCNIVGSFDFLYRSDTDAAMPTMHCYTPSDSSGIEATLEEQLYSLGINQGPSEFQGVQGEMWKRSGGVVIDGVAYKADSASLDLLNYSENEPSCYSSGTTQQESVATFEHTEVGIHVDDSSELVDDAEDSTSIATSSDEENTNADYTTTDHVDNDASAADPDSNVATEATEEYAGEGAGYANDVDAINPSSIPSDGHISDYDVIGDTGDDFIIGNEGDDSEVDEPIGFAPLNPDEGELVHQHAVTPSDFNIEYVEYTIDTAWWHVFAQD